MKRRRTTILVPVLAENADLRFTPGPVKVISYEGKAAEGRSEAHAMGYYRVGYMLLARQSDGLAYKKSEATKETGK